MFAADSMGLHSLHFKHIHHHFNHALYVYYCPSCEQFYLSLVLYMVAFVNFLLKKMVVVVVWSRYTWHWERLPGL